MPAPLPLSPSPPSPAVPLDPAGTDEPVLAPPFSIVVRDNWFEMMSRMADSHLTRPSALSARKRMGSLWPGFHTSNMVAVSSLSTSLTVARRRSTDPDISSLPPFERMPDVSFRSVPSCDIHSICPSTTATNTAFQNEPTFRFSTPSWSAATPSSMARCSNDPASPDRSKFFMSFAPATFAFCSASNDSTSMEMKRVSNLDSISSSESLSERPASTDSLTSERSAAGSSSFFSMAVRALVDSVSYRRRDSLSF
mmetsp:Transcript_1347/g.4229  ORF Transcript_1347/g.4229 Transcript_1347/m.4229 type:complete len:253 (+) Transcript_1347:844-1602(+)